MVADTHSGPSAKRPWSLNRQAFERLLERLGDDRHESAVAYERLRQRLIGLLDWWGATQAEDLADETLDRMARKLEEGAVVEDGSFGAYARGVARMIFLESTRRPVAQTAELPDVASPVSEDPDASLECFDRCLAAIGDRDRSLVLRYYADGKAKDVRRGLADELGLTPMALRIRVHRLRDRLEQCTRTCLERA